MMKPLIYAPIVLLLATGVAAADQDAVTKRVSSPPKVDGHNDDAAWQGAPVTVTRDRVADIDIEIRSVHDDKTVFFLVVSA